MAAVTRDHGVYLLVEYLGDLLVECVIGHGARRLGSRGNRRDVGGQCRPDRRADGLADRLPRRRRLLDDRDDVAGHNELADREAGNRKDGFRQRRAVCLGGIGEAPHATRQHRHAHDELAPMIVNRLSGDPDVGGVHAPPPFRIAVAAATMFFSAASVSSQPRVLRPQSGFTQICVSSSTRDMLCSAAMISSTGGTRGEWMSYTPGPISFGYLYCSKPCSSSEPERAFSIEITSASIRSITRSTSLNSL